jgi:hypothetical protein
LCSRDLEADEEMKNGAAAGPLFIQGASSSMHVVAVGEMACARKHCVCAPSQETRPNLYLHSLMLARAILLPCSIIKVVTTLSCPIATRTQTVSVDLVLPSRYLEAPPTASRDGENFTLGFSSSQKGIIHMLNQLEEPVREETDRQ